jgi:DNA-binding response OmpR family regulator
MMPSAARVLVVDDEEDIVAYLAAVLRDHGFEALAETDAAAALATARQEHPDLILLDIMMPGESGISLYRRLRRDSGTAGIPVIILTGSSQREDVVPLIEHDEAGAIGPPDGYLEKPVGASEVIRHVQSLVEMMGGASRHDRS